MTDPPAEELEEDPEDWNDTSWAQPTQPPRKRLYSPLPGTAQEPQADVQPTRGKGSSLTVSSLEGTNMAESTDSSNEGRIVSRMQLNDHKAGMQGLDRERINAIILEASKGSRFYENELKKEQQVNARVEEQRQRMAVLTSVDTLYGEQQGDILLSQLEENRDLSRCIIHLDMDAFYAAVEMRDKPSLRHKPMAVGSNSMLSTSNYLARRYGVRAAMPGFIGKKLCPDLVIMPVNFEKYTAVSKKVRAVLADYDPNFSPMSLDEAYLDITEYIRQRSTSAKPLRHFWKGHELCQCSHSTGKNKMQTACVGSEAVTGEGCRLLSQDVSSFAGEPSPGTQFISCEECGKMLTCSVDIVGEVKVFGCSDEDIVQEMRYRIEMETQLTASAGIAPNTMIAKVCSDKNKPNGQCKIASTRQAVMDFMRDLPIRKVCGIGKVSEKMLSALGVKLCPDLYHKRGLLYHLYSTLSFQHFMRIAAGVGSTRLESDSDRKSISVERTFSELHKPCELYARCHELSESLAEDLKEENLLGKTVTLKFKTVSFQQKTRAQTLKNYTANMDVIYEAASELLRTEIQGCHPHPLRLRLMGVRMSNLVHGSELESKQNSIKNIFQRVSSPLSPQKSPVGTVSGPVSMRQTSELQSTLPAGKTTIKSLFQKALAPCPNTPTTLPDPDLVERTPDVSDGSTNKRASRACTVCPVCGKEIRSRSLTILTVHIDKCLMRQASDALAAESGDPGKESIPNSRQCSSGQDLCAPSTGKTELSGDHSEILVNNAGDCSDINKGKYTDKNHNKGSVADNSSHLILEHLDKIDCPTNDTDLHPANDSGVCVSALQHAIRTKTPKSQAYKNPGTRSTPGKPCERATVSSALSSKPVPSSCPAGSSVSRPESITHPSGGESSCLPAATGSDVSQKPKSAEQVFSELLDTLAQEKAKLWSSQCPSASPLGSQLDIEAIGTVNEDCPDRSQDLPEESLGLNVAQDAENGHGSGDPSHLLPCPVCSLLQPPGDMRAFNEHVDSCLNRRAIRDMLKEEQGQTSGKRLSVEASGPPNKKKKLAPVRTIDSFFTSGKK